MAIVLHAARATRHWVPVGIRRGDRMYHVLSDLHGAAGSEELRGAALRCGLRAEWVQYPGSYREHYDIPPRTVECLQRNGARLVTTRELGALLAAKRAAGPP